MLERASGGTTFGEGDLMMEGETLLGCIGSFDFRRTVLLEGRRALPEGGRDGFPVGSGGGEAKYLIKLIINNQLTLYTSNLPAMIMACKYSKIGGVNDDITTEVPTSWLFSPQKEIAKPWYPKVSSSVNCNEVIAGSGLYSKESLWVPYYL